MGFIRFLLAVSVIFAHAGGLRGYEITGGEVAVQAFFIISGFYMAMILTKKYTGEGYYILFLSNRFYRIFPTYWAILLISIILNNYVFNGFNLSNPFNGLPTNSSIFLILSNIVIYGQDVALFLGFHNGSLHFVSDFTKSTPAVHSFLILPQAWSLATELTFYLIAPFLVRRSNLTIVIIIALCFSMRLLASAGFGLVHDPWSYRFFPFEIGMFMGGALSYRLYEKNKDKHKKLQSCASLFIVIIFSLSFSEIPLHTTIIGIDAKRWIYYVALTLSIPPIFSLTKNSTIDRYIGNLSYPLYVTHIMSMSILQHYNIHGMIYIISLSLAISIGIEKFITSPIEKIREQRVKNRSNNRPINTIKTSISDCC